MSSLLLIVLISGWFMQAYVSSNITQQYDTSVELYRQAVEILQWGRQEWKDVPSEDRGSMFELTYIRAIKRIPLLRYASSVQNVPSDISMFRHMTLVVNLIPRSNWTMR